LPLAVRTWAPCGQTPVLRVPLTHDHLAAIGGLTPDGRLFLQTQDHAYRSPDVVRFLQVLLRKVERADHHDEGEPRDECDDAENRRTRMPAPAAAIA